MLILKFLVLFCLFCGLAGGCIMWDIMSEDRE